MFLQSCPAPRRERALLYLIGTFLLSYTCTLAMTDLVSDMFFGVKYPIKHTGASAD
jgi:hypothetical protein